MLMLLLENNEEELWMLIDPEFQPPSKLGNDDAAMDEKSVLVDPMVELSLANQLLS